MNKYDIIKYIEKNDINDVELNILKNLLKNKNSFILKQVHNLISKNHSLINRFLEIIKDYNINTKLIEEIQKICYNHSEESINNCINTFLNNKISIYNNLTSINDPNFIEYFIDENVKNDLYNLSKTGLGKGEIILTLILKNALLNTYKRGDIIIDDNIVEVKSNNARLLNQSDFGNGEDVSNYWITEIRKYNVKILPDYDKNIKWNMTKNNNYLNFYINELKSKTSNETIANIICSGWDKLFINKKMDRNIILKILNKYNNFDDIAFKEYAFEMFLYNLKYYLSESNIDYLILTNVEGYFIFEKSFFYSNKKELRKFCKKYLLFKYPSFTKTAANSRVFSISVLEG